MILSLDYILYDIRWNKCSDNIIQVICLYQIRPADNIITDGKQSNEKISVCLYFNMQSLHILDKYNIWSIAFICFNWLVEFRWRRATDISSYHNLPVFPAVDVAWSLILINSINFDTHILQTQNEKLVEYM